MEGPVPATKLILPSAFWCVHLCLPPHIVVHVEASTCGCMEARDQPCLSFPRCCPPRPGFVVPWFFEGQSLTGLELSMKASLAGQRALAILHSLPLQGWD